MNDATEEYARRYNAFLQIIAQNLEAHLRGLLDGIPNVDRVAARAKDPGRFVAKAERLDDHGAPKYRAPLTEIQDQIGGRVIVFYISDVMAVRDCMTRYFQPIEQRELVPESQWSFGYFGYHLVLPLPRDAIPELVPVSETPSFFELQIKTLFQHAWSEANHDLGYKARTRLSLEQERRLAYTAAQAWGADRMFEELRLELNK